MGGSNVQYTVTGTNIPQGVTWMLDPEGEPDGATLASSVNIADVTPGNVPMIYRIIAASVDCPNLYDEAKLKVCELESIEPDHIANLQEIDDSDFNLKTRTFLVPIAQEFEFPVWPVTVKAVLNPNLTEAEVPAGWTLQGGGGSEKLTRYIGREVIAGPSKTELTFSFDGVDSGFKTTIYVYDAKVGLFAENGGANLLSVGHSWGRYTINDEMRTADIIPFVYWGYLREIGFFPTNTADWGQILLGVSVPGDVRLGIEAVGNHWPPTGWKEYPILFDALSSALPAVMASDLNPPGYDLYNVNCTDYAIWLGKIVNTDTMDPAGVSTPWDFSDWLNSH